MLDRRHRLRRRNEFTAAVRAGRRAGRATLVVHLRPPEPGASVDPVGDPPRAGFIVSRAVGGAVVRNAVRRRLRHLVRPHLADLPPGSLLVVRALPPAAGAPSTRLAADLAGALRTVSRPPRRRATGRGEPRPAAGATAGRGGPPVPEPAP